MYLTYRRVYDNATPTMWEYIGIAFLLTLFLGIPIKIIGVFVSQAFGRSRGSDYQKANWIRTKTSRFYDRFALATLTVVSGLTYAAFERHMWVVWLLPIAFYVGVAWLYSQSLKRKWKLWQQLGYDGPPDLAQQQQKLFGDRGQKAS